MRQIDKAKNNSLGLSQTGSVTRQVDNPVNALGYLWSSAPEGEKAERSLRKKILPTKRNCFSWKSVKTFFWDMKGTSNSDKRV